MRLHIVEKEAYAIVECVRKWRDFIAGKHFTIVTDQRAVSFMFKPANRGKIKNDKIIRWKMELLPFSYDIKHRPGNENIVADTLSRVCGATASSLEELRSMHNSLIHPGVQCFWHFVRSQNMPYSLDEVRRVTSECTTCARIKPQFFDSATNILIHSTAPFQRLSIDYKGPIPVSSTGYRYIFTVVDEYSRFSFLLSLVVIALLEPLFGV